MEKIANNLTDENLVIDYDVTKQDFQDFFFNLMETEENITKQLTELSKHQLVEIPESDTNIPIVKDISSYIQEKIDFIVKSLQIILKFIVKIFSPTVLEDLFDRLINVWIQKSRQTAQILFLSLKQIYGLFYIFGLRNISSTAIDELTGALQWDIISPRWLDYNFLMDYYKKLSLRVSKELKEKTWILVELTRIKKKELESKVHEVSYLKSFE
jgi:hypothetical protein